MRFAMSKLLNVSEKSYYRWKNEDHIHLVALIEKYFTKEDIEEFIECGKISRYEDSILPKQQSAVIESAIFLLRNEYLNYFISKNMGIHMWHDFSQKWYFSYLAFLKSNHKRYNHLDNPFFASSMYFRVHQNEAGARVDFEANIVPLISWLESKSGMWIYLTSALQTDLQDLLLCDKKYEEEAQNHIEELKIYL